MKGRTWIIADGLYTVTYSLAGKMLEVKFSEEVTPEQLLWFFDHFAIMAADMDGIAAFMQKLGKSRKVVEQPADTSFSRFWDEYGHKVGKKEAESAWKRLNNTKRTDALLGIRKYKAYSLSKHYDLAYPAKYLNKELYNDFQ